MVKPVDRMVPEFACAGADVITFHPDATENIGRTIDLIHDHGCKAGLALNPRRRWRGWTRRLENWMWS
jgi:ribulose-phosphate 3-epimerase